MGLPGLTEECKTFFEDLEILNCLTNKISILKWKCLVKKAIHKKNEFEIREAMKSKKKLKDRKISEDKYGLKKLHGWKCDECGNLDSEDHLL